MTQLFSFAYSPQGRAFFAVRSVGSKGCLNKFFVRQQAKIIFVNLCPSLNH